MTIRIADPETGRELPPDEPGAVEVRGYVTPGYCGASAEHNAAAFTADGYFRTGDLGFLDGDGNFHFVGRDSDMIKRAGINVSPAEVESLLLQCPGVSQAAVVGAPAGERGEAIVAFIVPAPGAELDEEAVRGMLPRPRLGLQNPRPYRGLRRLAGHRNRQAPPPSPQGPGAGNIMIRRIKVREGTRGGYE